MTLRSRKILAPQGINIPEFYHWIFIIVHITTSPAVIKLSLNFLLFWQISKLHEVNDVLSIIVSSEAEMVSDAVVSEKKNEGRKKK